MLNRAALIIVCVVANLGCLGIQPDPSISSPLHKQPPVARRGAGPRFAFQPRPPFSFSHNRLIAAQAVYAVLGSEGSAILPLLVAKGEWTAIQPGDLAALMRTSQVAALILSADRAGGDGATDIQAARAANIPVVLLQRQTTVAAILANIGTLADLTDNRQSGNRWIFQIADGIAQIQDQVHGLAVVRALVLSPEGYTQGQGALITELIALAGGINVAAAAGIPEARQVDDTQIRQFAPEVVFLLGWDEAAAEILVASPQYRGIPAFDDRRVYRIDTPGRDPVRLVADVRRLSRLLHAP